MQNLKLLHSYVIRNHYSPEHGYDDECYVDIVFEKCLEIYSTPLPFFDGLDGDDAYFMTYEGEFVNWSDRHPYIGGEAKFAKSSVDASHSWGMYFTQQRGYRSETRLNDWVFALTIHDKMALADHMAQFMPHPTIIGLAYSQAKAQVELDGKTWICRDVGVAHVVDKPFADYEITVVRFFHPADTDALETPLLDGVKLLMPYNPIRDGNKLIISDSVEPAKAYVWEILDA